MLSNILDRVAFWSIYVVVVLLPIFFIPFTKIPAEASKTLLVVIGASVSLMAWAGARFSDGKIYIPKSFVLLSGLGVVFVTLLSALFSSNRTSSFFGAMFDVGTFWFLCAGYILMLLASMVVRTEKQGKKILSGLLASISVVLFFQTLRYFMPDLLSFGVLGGKTSNPFGSWYSFGFLAGVSSLISIFLLEFAHTSKKIRIALYALLGLSLVTVIAINSTLLWKILGVSALVIFVYRIATYVGNRRSMFPVYAFVTILLSLLFLLSGRFIGGLLPNALGLSNVEISPSVETTFAVGQKIITQYPVLGIGPNRFAEAWALWKPIIINNTQFWDTAFGSGFGFLPTVAINNGTLGILSWLVFVGTILAAVFAYIRKTFKDTKSPITVAWAFVVLFILISNFFYSFGIGMIMLLFVSLGVFASMRTDFESTEVMEIDFLNDPRKSFVSILFLVLLMIGAAGTSFKFVERFASVPYFNGSLMATNVAQAESLIDKAISLHQNDLYFRTYAQIELAQLSLLAQKQNISNEEQATLQTIFDKALQSATLAINYDPKNYINHQMLGVVYSTAGRLGVEGAGDKAIEAYNVASKLNPLNPGLKLSVANEYSNANKNTEAKKFAEEALSLSPNYIDALVFLAQTEKRLGNTNKATEYAERALVLNPNDKNLVEFANNIKSNQSNATKEEVKDKKSE